LGVITARTAGFCWGVRRAVDMVLAALREGDEPYAVYGELVHNPQVLEALAGRGVGICGDPASMEGGTLFLRTHGTTLEKMRELSGLPLKIRDLTCPRVGRVLSLAGKKAAEGYDVVILGDPGHQEVKCIVSYGGPGAVVVRGPEDVERLDDLKKPFLLSQTTQNTEVWEETRRRMVRRFPGLKWSRTICGSTDRRQEELRKLCGRVDCVVVVGGKNSANTARLVEIAREEGLPAFHVETHEDMDPDKLGKYGEILLTAGASTPSWSIRKVRERLLEIQGSLGTGRARRFLGNCVFGNFHVLPVAFVLAAAGACVMKIEEWFMPALASSLFLFAAHLLNSVLESGYSHPSRLGRQEFLRRHRTLFTLLAVAAFAGSLAVSFFLPMPWPVLLVMMLLVFLLYSLPLVRNGNPPGGLRNLPGSRDLIFAGAWSFLLAIVPGFVYGGFESGTVLWAAMLFFLFLGRGLLADLVDLRGDALMGMDTIPIHAGRERSVMFFWGCVVVTLLLLAFGVLSGELEASMSWFAAGPLALAAGYVLLGLVPFPSEQAKRAAADGSLLLAGLLPVLARSLGGIRC